MMPGDLDLGKEKFSHGIFGFQVSTVGADNPELKQLLQYNPTLTARETVKKINEIQQFFCRKNQVGNSYYCF